MDFTQILGYTAGAITSLTFLPQVIKTWKEKSATNISLMMFLIAVTHEAMWITYGILRHDMVIIVTNAFLFIMSWIMIYFKLTYK